MYIGWLDPFSNDADEDPDHDGFTNFQEMELGTHPGISNEISGPDRDGDGYPDDMDECPDDSSGWLNNDLDEFCDDTDPDDDNDGMPDTWERLYLPTLDPWSPDADADPDGDDVSNIDEMEQGTDPTKPNTISDPDRDEDGYPDDVDECPDDPSGWLNNDRDAFCDNNDADDDNDGMPDDWEIQYLPTLNPWLKDADDDPDKDGASNFIEMERGTDPTKPDGIFGRDSDNDGIPDDKDAFPYDPDEWFDHDGDGLGDNQDTDDDNDGMPDDWERANGLQQYINDALNDPDLDLAANIDEYLAGTNPKNAVPDTPVPISPADGADNLPLTPLLATQPFYDRNNDGHDASHWQISTDPDHTDLTLDITSATQLTDLQIPVLLLTNGETYYWRVRFYDDDQNAYDEVSEWSRTSAFTVVAAPPYDTDGNGTPDDQEIDGDEFLDMDGNGISDLEQDDMGCIHGGADDQPLCIKVPDTVFSIDAMSWVDPADIDETDNRPLALPFGLISFRLSVIPGSEIEVTLYLSAAAGSELEWYKYDSINGWHNFHSYTTFSPDRTAVTIRLKDGGFGDGDGAENGTLLDPSGPGSNPRTIYDDYDGIGGNSPYGCFVQVLQ